MADESLITIELLYEQTKQRIDAPGIVPSFVLEDTIDIFGTVFGRDLTGLSAKLSACLVLGNGSISAPVFTKTSAANGGIILTQVSPTAYKVRISIASSNTSAFEVGQKVVFDVEFSTTTTPPVKRTKKGSFVLEEQYTVG